MLITPDQSILWPNHSFLTTSGNVLSLTAAGEKVAGIFLAPKTGNISTLAIRTSTCSGTNTCKVSVQGVDSSGYPDGTIKGSGNAYQGSLTFATTTVYTITLGASAAVTMGEQFAIVIEFDSYTSGSVAIRTIGKVVNQLTYAARYASSAWAKDTISVGLAAGIGYDDGTYPQWPWSSPFIQNSSSVTSTSTPDEVGGRLILPFDCVAIGYTAMIDYDGDCYLKYYGPGGDQSTALTAANRPSNSANLVGMFFTKPVPLRRGDKAYISILGNSATATVVYWVQGFGGSWDKQLPVQNNLSVLATRKSGGAWTEYASYRPMVSLLLSHVDDTAKPYRWRGSYGRRG